LGCPEGELSVVIVDEHEITNINREYLHRHGPANVISFAMNEGEFGDVNPHLLGDVIICADTARKEAEIGGMTFESRFDALLIHGILHLFGYDHENAADEAECMNAKAAELEALIIDEIL